jgi:hypothetical protein
MQPLPPVASGGIELVTQRVPRNRGAPANPNLDSAEIVAAESVALEPALDVAKQLVRAHATTEYSKRDQRFRHDGGSYARRRIGEPRSRPAQADSQGGRLSASASGWMRCPTPGAAGPWAKVRGPHGAENEKAAAGHSSS